VFLGFHATVVGGFIVAPRLAQLDWAADAFGPAVRMLQEAHRVEGKLLAVVGGSGLVFLLGLLDDKLGARFPVAAKAAGELAAAIVLVAAGVEISLFPWPWLNSIVTLVWIVGITNAFNLLDNMDGLAAGVACAASLVLLINAVMLGEFFIALILAAFIGALLGFLAYNFHPASVFLGDCGSLFIGYLIASLTLLERYVSHASSTLFPVLMPVVVLAIPLLDTATVIVIRLREHRPIYVGDTRHLSHRLVSMGFSTRAAVLFLYLATFTLGLGAASLTDATPGQAAMILLQTAGIVALLVILLFLERRRQPRDVAP